MSRKQGAWGRAIGTAAGSILAGPSGAMVGNLAGGIFEALLPDLSEIAHLVMAEFTAEGIQKAGEAIADRLRPEEKQRINHDIQTAFRDALREAIFDIGGKDCFPEVWQRSHRDAPESVIFPLTPQGHRLWQENDPLAEQVCLCLKQMDLAIANEPLSPPGLSLEQSYVSYLLSADTLQSLNDVFCEQALAPYLARFKSLIDEVPQFESHLKRHLLDRTMVHLGELLKARTPAWRAFSRMMLEAMRDQLNRMDVKQENIIERLDALLAQSNSPQFAEWVNGLADLLTATGELEKRLDEGLDAVLTRTVEQHQEVLSRFETLTAIAGRVETKVERVLRFLEDGRWVIEGAPPIPADRSPTPGESPFKGLRYFDQSDREIFYGRERLTARLVHRLGEQRFLAVIGASGSGKSSVVRAGLAPTLRLEEPLADGTLPPAGSARWPIHVITPTARPLEALAFTLKQGLASASQTAELAEDFARNASTLQRRVDEILIHRGSERLLLIVDQFEELFTLCRKESERKAFIDNLMRAVASAAAGKAIIVIALRADFYAQCAEYPQLREALSKAQEFIGPMTQEELRRAIEEPALRNGWSFESGLVDLILRDVGEEPGALPLLSHALLETWKHRRGRTMTLESYAESGGVRGAIALTAESVYRQQLTPPQRRIARGIFLRLTELGEGNLGSRRRVDVGELFLRPEEHEEAQDVLRALADARLVTIEEETAEVAHEALIREWPALRQWLEEGRESLFVHRHLTLTAHEWITLNRDAGALYRGARLEQAKEWAALHGEDLNLQEREFLEASRALQISELEAAEKRARQLRRRLVYVGSALIAAIAMAALALFYAGRASQNQQAADINLGTARAAGTYAVAQQNTAQANADARGTQQSRAEAEAQSRATQQALAEQQSRLGLSRELAIRSSDWLEIDPALGLLLAMQSTKVTYDLDGTYTPESMQALYHALIDSPFRGKLNGITSPIVSVVMSPSGTRFVTVLEEGAPEIWSVRGERLTSLDGHAGAVRSASYSPEGTLIVTASDDGTARLWDDVGSPLSVLAGHKGPVSSAVFSPDGTLILTAGEDGTARLWDERGRSLAVLDVPGTEVGSAGFSPNGNRIITTSPDGTVRLWDRSGNIIVSFRPEILRIDQVRVSPDGDRILLAGCNRWQDPYYCERGQMWLWNVGGELLAILTDQAVIRTMQFNRDGTRFVSSGCSGASVMGCDAGATLWDRDGRLVKVLTGHGGNYEGVGVSVFSPDGQRLVTADYGGKAQVWDSDGNLLHVLGGHTARIGSVAFSAEGTRILTSSNDGTTRLWDSEGKNVLVLGGSQWIKQAVMSPDAKHVVTLYQDGSARLWDLRGGITDEAVGADASAVFSPDGTRILIAGSGGAWLWDYSRGGEPSDLQGQLGAVNSASFSPRGNLVVTAGEDGRARLWDERGNLLTQVSPGGWPLNDATFSSDGTKIVTTDENRFARLRDIDGRLLAQQEIHGWGFLRIGGVLSGDGSSPDRISTLVLLRMGHSGYLWDTDRNLLKDFSFKNPAGGSTYVNSVMFSPSGDAVLVGGCGRYTNPIGLTCLEGGLGILPPLGSSMREWKAHSGYISQARFSPDEKRIVAASNDSSASLWEVAQGSLLARLLGHAGPIWSASFNQTGSLIVTASEDGTARLWDQDGNFVVTLDGRSGPLLSAEFSPDGSRLLTRAEDGTVLLWDVWSDMDSMLLEAARRAGRDLTVEECRQFLHIDECP